MDNLHDGLDSIDGLELAEVPTEGEKRLLIEKVYTSTLDSEERAQFIEEINSCLSYKIYQNLEFSLEHFQQPIDQMVNYNQGDIKNFLRRIK